MFVINCTANMARISLTLIRLRKGAFATNSDFLILKSLKPDVVDLQNSVTSDIKLISLKI